MYAPGLGQRLEARAPLWEELRDALEDGLLGARDTRKTCLSSLSRARSKASLLDLGRQVRKRAALYPPRCLIYLPSSHPSTTSSLNLSLRFTTRTYGVRHLGWSRPTSTCLPRARASTA